MYMVHVEVVQKGQKSLLCGFEVFESNIRCLFQLDSSKNSTPQKTPYIKLQLLKTILALPITMLGNFLSNYFLLRLSVTVFSPRSFSVEKKQGPYFYI